MIMFRAKKSIGKKTLKPVLNICLFLLVTSVSASWGIQTEISSASSCTFSKYIKAPENRATFESELAKARRRLAKVNTYDNAAMSGVFAKKNFTFENSEYLDTFSAICLSCHDGKSASKVMPNLKNSPNKKNIIMAISVKHPIGMDYNRYAAANSNLKSMDEMSLDLYLVEGRVSCITCHDPLNSGKNHLTITKTGIDLCSACHAM
jgi:predicted CXXCH cytochrome family protein